MSTGHTREVYRARPHQTSTPTASRHPTAHSALVTDHEALAAELHKSSPSPVGHMVQAVTRPITVSTTKGSTRAHHGGRRRRCPVQAAPFQRRTSPLDTGRSGSGYQPAGATHASLGVATAAGLEAMGLTRQSLRRHGLTRRDRSRALLPRHPAVRPSRPDTEIGLGSWSCGVVTPTSRTRNADQIRHAHPPAETTSNGRGQRHPQRVVEGVTPSRSSTPGHRAPTAAQGHQ